MPISWGSAKVPEVSLSCLVSCISSSNRILLPVGDKSGPFEPSLFTLPMMYHKQDLPALLIKQYFVKCFHGHNPTVLKICYADIFSVTQNHKCMPCSAVGTWMLFFCFLLLLHWYGFSLCKLESAVNLRLSVRLHKCGRGGGICTNVPFLDSFLTCSKLYADPLDTSGDSAC